MRTEFPNQQAEEILARNWTPENLSSNLRDLGDLAWGLVLLEEEQE